ncbi:hypothetical protein HB777_24230 [Mesorhizobium loti]|nr:hypothetical protein HB777_24230 [Mesorhizobium loti]
MTSKRPPIGMNSTKLSPLANELEAIIRDLVNMVEEAQKPKALAMADRALVILADEMDATRVNKNRRNGGNLSQEFKNIMQSVADRNPALSGKS